MDFIIELICEIFGGILEAILESDRIPIWVRWLIIAPLLGVPIALIIHTIIHADDIPTMILLGIAALILVVLLILPLCSVLRSGVLRTARKEDLPEILKMYRSVIGKNGCNWSIAYPNEATLHEDFRTGNLYVLWRGNKMIGAGSIVPRNELDDLNLWQQREKAGEIARIVVAPAYQSKGHGKHLVKKLCYKLESKDYRAVHLLVSTENHHALNLYREAGFYCMGQCERYDHTYYAFEKKLSC